MCRAKITAYHVGVLGLRPSNAIIISKFLKVENELDSRMEKRKEIISGPEEITM